MKIEISKIKEPELEFGNEYKHAYIRDALKSGCGPYDSNFYEGIKTVNLGLIVLPDKLQNVLRWIESLKDSILPDENNFLKYPEFSGSENILKCKFELKEKHIKEIDPNKFSLAINLSYRERFNKLLDLYVENVTALISDSSPDCILIYFPEELAALRVENPRLSFEERNYLQKINQEDDDDQLELFEMTPDQKKLAEELLPQAEELLFRNFHRALKAKCMKIPNGIPIQIIRDHTINPDSTSQSVSTIAWNLGLALYYKSGNIPWRLTDIAQDTCFVGISFHHLKKRSGDVMYASLAQAFSSSGEGFALKGSNIPKEQRKNKRPYLLPNQAEDLIEKVLKDYENKNGNFPLRVVIHKTSRYEIEEIEGFKSGLAKSIPNFELVWFVPSVFRLLKRGFDPPERGTLCTIENNENFLFTTGYIQNWKEYPGPHIPSPLQIGSPDKIDFKQASREVLALTKMNWNSSDGIGRFPITLSFARRVGMIMTELEDDEEPNPSYKFYM